MQGHGDHDDHLASELQSAHFTKVTTGPRCDRCVMGAFRFRLNWIVVIAVILHFLKDLLTAADGVIAFLFHNATPPSRSCTQSHLVSGADVLERKG